MRKSRWLVIGHVLFRVFMGRDQVEVYKHAKKNKVINQPS